MYPTISDNAAVQKRYVELRKSGQSHNMAEMLATRTPAGTHGTDRAFWQGRMLNHGLEDNFIGRTMLNQARAAGISVDGKVYIGGLADKRGARDPRAWVSDLGDIKRRCEQEGWGCDGLVKVKGCEPPPLEQVRLADDLVHECMQNELKKHPGKAADLHALREEVIERHGQKKDDVNFAPKSETKPKRKIRKVV